MQIAPRRHSRVKTTFPPAQQDQNHVTPSAARPLIPASCTDPLAVRTPNREPAESLVSALERPFLVYIDNYGMVPELPSQSKMDMKFPSVGHSWYAARGNSHGFMYYEQYSCGIFLQGPSDLINLSWLSTQNLVRGARHLHRNHSCLC